MNDLMSPAILKTIKDIAATKLEAVFGGSIALVCVGLLNRPVKDIDIFVPHDTLLVKSGVLAIEGSTEITSETVTKTNGKEIQRVGVTINGVRCCIFYVDAEELQHSMHVIDDESDGSHTPIRVQNVNYAIMAKRSYADRSGKHKEDLNAIDQYLSNI